MRHLKIIVVMGFIGSAFALASLAEAQSAQQIKWCNGEEITGSKPTLKQPMDKQYNLR